MGILFFGLGAAVAIIGAGLFSQARTARKHDRAQQSWPSVKGTLTSSEVVLSPAVTMGRTVYPDQYDVSVKYEFRAGGQLHFGTTISYPRLLHEKLEADGIASRYPAGAAVTVYYNPEDYRECCLEIRTTARYYRTSIVLTAVGGMAALFGIFLLFD